MWAVNMSNFLKFKIGIQVVKVIYENTYMYLNSNPRIEDTHHQLSLSPTNWKTEK